MLYSIAANSWELLDALAIGCPSRRRPQYFAVSVAAAHLLCQAFYLDAPRCLLQVATSDGRANLFRITASGDLDQCATGAAVRSMRL